MIDVFKPVVQRGAEATKPLSKWAAVELQVVVRPGVSIYIEWPEHEPMENVLAAIHCTERGAKGDWRAVFDMADDMIEALVGGYRLHGMFAHELI